MTALRKWLALLALLGAGQLAQAHIASNGFLSRVHTYPAHWNFPSATASSRSGWTGTAMAKSPGASCAPVRPPCRPMRSSPFI